MKGSLNCGVVKTGRELLIEYLYDFCVIEKNTYTCARHIATDLGMTSRQVGVYLGQLNRAPPMIRGYVLKIAKYSRSTSTTWGISGNAVV